nr:hypothetical protein [Gammaproteobacteria bacterium]
MFSTNGVQRFKLYFTHFTDDSSPTFTVETATNNGTSGSQYRSGYSLVADTEASGVDNYLPYPNGSNSGQVFLQGDDGGTTWSDQNSSSSIQTTAENATGISANIFTRDGNRVLAFITNASGTTVKYDEFT